MHHEIKITDVNYLEFLISAPESKSSHSLSGDIPTHKYKVLYN